MIIAQVRLRMTVLKVAFRSSASPRHVHRKGIVHRATVLTLRSNLWQAVVMKIIAALHLRRWVTKVIVRKLDVRMSIAVRQGRRCTALTMALVLRHVGMVINLAHALKGSALRVVGRIMVLARADLAMVVVMTTTARMMAGIVRLDRRLAC